MTCARCFEAHTSQQFPPRRAFTASSKTLLNAIQGRDGQSTLTHRKLLKTLGRRPSRAERPGASLFSQLFRPAIRQMAVVFQGAN
jgi:hypothetical protein